MRLDSNEGAAYTEEEKLQQAKKAGEQKAYRNIALFLAGALVVALLFLLIPRVNTLLSDPGGVTDHTQPVAQTTEAPEPTEKKQAPRFRYVLMDDTVDDKATDLSTHAVFGSAYQRQQIASVTFLDSTEGATATSWDVSEAQNGTVLAWVEPNGSLFDLYIAADGGVVAPKDCSAMFAYYSNVQQITFNHAFDTANVTDMALMFWQCEKLTELELSSFRTANVTDMRYLFSGCSRLNELDLSSFDTGNVTDMAAMFNECVELDELDVTGFDTGAVKSMNCMFRNCTDLSQLDVSTLDTAKVEDMGYMFYGCSNLAHLDVTRFDTGRVTNMEGMFSKCNGLTVLDVSRFDTRKVEDMESMFYKCSSLTVLDVSGFDTGNAEDMESMFYKCGGLTVLDVSGFDTAKVTDMRRMFFGCYKLTWLDLDGWDLSQVKEYEDFMDPGSTIDGCPWEHFFLYA